MVKKPTNPSRVVTGDAEQAMAEALGDLQLVIGGSSNQIEGSLIHAAAGVQYAFEE